MKHKRLDRDAWGFWHFPYYQLRVDTEDFHGLACLLRIPGGDYYYWEMPKAGRLAVCGEGMTWLELIPDGEHRVVTAKYFPDGKPGPERENYPSFVNKQYPVSVWYADVIEGMEDAEDGVAVFIDKYLDVIFSPEGDVKVDDRNELDAAYASGELTPEQYEAALAEGDAIRRELAEDIPATEARFARIRAHVEKRIQEIDWILLRREEKEVRHD